MHLGERAPGGEIAKRAPFGLDEAPVCGLAAGAAHNLVDQLKGCAFRSPEGVAVEEVIREVLRRRHNSELVDPRSLGRAEVAVLRDRLDPEIERAGEPAARRQIRRWLDRRYRLGRMQGVDNDEAGIQRPPRPGSEVGQVDEVPDAP